MKKIKFISIILIFILLFAAGCSKASNNASGEKIPEELDKLVSNAILKNEGSGKKSDFQTESHIILGTREKGNTVTVYVMAEYSGYNDLLISPGEYAQDDGCISPVALTFNKNKDGSYSLTEYWVPQDGEGYGDDIKKKFPFFLARKAINDEEYNKALNKECEDKAYDYFYSKSASKATAVSSNR